MSEFTLDDWPDCAVDGCQRKCCLALSSPYCFPHTPGNEHVKRIDIDMRLTVLSPARAADEFIRRRAEIELA